MIRYDIKGQILNYTGYGLSVVDSRGNVIRKFKNDGQVGIECSTVFLGYCNEKIELSYDCITGLRGLPPFHPDKYYIVTKPVARAAALTGRATSDLLVPDMPYRRNEGCASEIVGYQRLIPVIYYVQSV